MELLKKADSRRKKNIFPIIAFFVFILLFIFTFGRFFYQSKVEVDKLISVHMDQLSLAFQKINQDCKILGFLQEKSYTDFLNVKSFDGATVGSIITANPGNWQGPYLVDNPIIQGKFYEIMKFNSGYYVVPGTGVKLANGKVIGKDIVLQKDIDPELLIKEELSSSDGKPLIVKIILEQTNIPETVVQLSQIFEQINHDCRITVFSHAKNSINFLNVKNFAGSEVGSLNLEKPNNWQGPYINFNPMHQGKFYQVVSLKTGYYIVPGDGVILPDGRVIGKEIIFSPDFNIKSLRIQDVKFYAKIKSLSKEIEPFKEARLAESISQSLE